MTPDLEMLIDEFVKSPNSIDSIMSAQRWIQIARTRQDVQQFEHSEIAIRQALTITEQTNDLRNKACALNDMAVLYCKRERMEEALNLYRLAVSCNIELQDLKGEILSRSNLANLLVKQQRYSEARDELNHLVDYTKRTDNLDEPWIVFHSLYELENVLGNSRMAAQARQQAIDSYLVYRRKGGASYPGAAIYYQIYELISLSQVSAKTVKSSVDILDAINQAIQGTDAQIIDPTLRLEHEIQNLSQLIGQETCPHMRAIYSKCRAILQGERDLALAEDSELRFTDAVELRLLLEALIAK